MKHCKRCDTLKAADQFGPNAGRKDGLSVYCRLCTKAYMAGKQYDKARWAEKRAEESARNAAYRKANAERLTLESRARKAIARRERPDVVNARNKARKAAQRRAVPPRADKKAIGLIYSKAKELSKAFGVDLHVDHVVPLRSKLVCGLHTVDNLQLLDESLNYEKRNWRWPDMP
jgi:hypothetical protein